MYATKQRTNMVAKIMTEAELLQRDLTLLLAVVQHGPIGLVRLSRKTGLPQHKVRYSLRILQQDGLIEPTPEGAIATEKLQEMLPRIRNEVAECRGNMEKTNNLIENISVV